MRTPSFALSLTLSFTALFTARASASDLVPAKVWKSDFAAAQEEAKQLHRPLVIHFYATWCGPCRKMEREVLDTAQVLKIIDAGFVGAKVDVVKNPAVQKKFKVDILPTDVIVSPDGKILARSEGYEDMARGGDRDFRKYLTNINRIDAQYAAEGKRLARTDVVGENKPQQQQPAVVANNTPAKTVPAAATTPSTTGDKLVPPPTEPKKVVEVAVESPATPTPEEQNEPEVPVVTDKAATSAAGMLLAMEGYCPVTLRMTRAWKTGSSDITHEHEGQTFYFAAQEKRDEFKANPAKYAPRLLGCDPVVLSRNDLAVRGSVKFGAYYEGELFLFQSAESRATFRKNPAHYAKLQHTLRLEDVKKVATTAQ
jgi:YHS domain-containing protein/thiol-disulfide isomerase/thioredoxin